MHRIFLNVGGIPVPLVSITAQGLADFLRLLPKLIGHEERTYISVIGWGGQQTMAIIVPWTEVTDSLNEPALLVEAMESQLNGSAPGSGLGHGVRYFDAYAPAKAATQKSIALITDAKVSWVSNGLPAQTARSKADAAGVDVRVYVVGGGTRYQVAGVGDSDVLRPPHDLSQYETTDAPPESAIHGLRTLDAFNGVSFVDRPDDFTQQMRTLFLSGGCLIS